MIIDKKQLKKIMDDLKEVVKQFTDEIEELDGINLPLDLDTLFKEACSFYRQSLIPNKYSQQENTSNKKQDSKATSFQSPADTFNKPTDKQLFFLKKRGVTIPKTKEEATKMIQKLKDWE